MNALWRMAHRAAAVTKGPGVKRVSLIGVVDRSYVASNARELARMKALVARLSDEQLAAMANEYWSVAGILGHIPFWDGRALFLAGKLQRADPFAPPDNHPQDV